MAAPSSEQNEASGDVASNSEVEEELKRVLLGYGNGLLKPGDSVEELLWKLDKLEHILQHLMQEHKPLIEMALKPAEEALVSNALLRHVEVDVRITVVSCITEILRITAPKEPYNADQMKEYFRLVNIAYGKLPLLAGRAYSKAVSIIQAVSSCQICVLMLDFELHDMVLEMFHLFLDGIQLSHPQEIFLNMERIMILIIQNVEDSDSDSEAFLVEVMKILISTLKKGNKNVSLCAFQLAMKVFEICAKDLKKYLPEAVRHVGIAIEEYDDIVVSSFHSTTESDNMNAKEIETDACARGDVNIAGDLVLSNFVEKNCSDSLKDDENIAENHGMLAHSSDQINQQDNHFQEAKDTGIEGCYHGEVNPVGVGELFYLVESNDNDNLQGDENPTENREKGTCLDDQIDQQECLWGGNISTSGPDLDKINSNIIDNSHLGEVNSSHNLSSILMPFKQVSRMKHDDVNENDGSLEINSTDASISAPTVKVEGTHHVRRETKQEDSPILQKRIRKPRSIIRSEEGYDPLWMLSSIKDSCNRKKSRKNVCLRNINSISRSPMSSSDPVNEPINAELKPEKKFIRAKKPGATDEDNGLYLLSTSVNTLSESMASKYTVEEECTKEKLEKCSGKSLLACKTNGILKNQMKRKRSIARVAPQNKMSTNMVVLEAATSKDSVELTKLKQEQNKVVNKRIPANRIDRVPKHLEKEVGAPNKVAHLGEKLGKSVITGNTGKELGKSVVSEDLSGDILLKTLVFQSRNKSSERASSVDVSNPREQMIVILPEAEIYSKKRQCSSANKILGETIGGKTIISENLTGDIIAKTLAETTSYKEKSHSKDISYPKQHDKASEVNDTNNLNGEDLVGCRMKIWWPLDETYYKGTVTCFDHLKKTHQIDYDDGETEILDLTKECWEMIGNDNLSSHEQETAPPPSNAPNSCIP